MSFGEFLRTRLFEPLGMVDTAFWCPSEKRDRFASCYQPDGAGGIQAAGRCWQQHPCRAAQIGIRRWGTGLGPRTITCGFVG